MPDGAQVRARLRTPDTHRRLAAAIRGSSECTSPPASRATSPWLRRRDGTADAPRATRDDGGTMPDRDVPCRPAAATNWPAGRPADRRGVPHRTAGGPDQKARGFVRSPPEPAANSPQLDSVYPRIWQPVSSAATSPLVSPKSRTTAGNLHCSIQIGLDPVDKATGRAAPIGGREDGSPSPRAAAHERRLRRPPARPSSESCTEPGRARSADRTRARGANRCRAGQGPAPARGGAMPRLPRSIARAQACRPAASQ